MIRLAQMERLNQALRKLDQPAKNPFILGGSGEVQIGNRMVRVELSGRVMLYLIREGRELFHDVGRINLADRKWPENLATVVVEALSERPDLRLVHVGSPTVVTSASPAQMVVVPTLIDDPWVPLVWSPDPVGKKGRLFANRLGLVRWSSGESVLFKERGKRKVTVRVSRRIDIPLADALLHTFVGPPAMAGAVASFRDKNPNNLRVENLYWRAKNRPPLTEEQVNQIFSMNLEGVPSSVIAKTIETHPSTVRHVLKGRCGADQPVWEAFENRRVELLRGRDQRGLRDQAAHTSMRARLAHYLATGETVPTPEKKKRRSLSPPLELSVVERILGLWETGKSAKEIGAEMGLATNHVGRAIAGEQNNSTVKGGRELIFREAEPRRLQALKGRTTAGIPDDDRAIQIRERLAREHRVTAG